MHFPPTYQLFHDLIFFIDKNGYFRDYYKPESAKKLYAPPQEFLGKKYDQVLPSEVKNLLTNAIKAIKRGKKSVEFEYPLEINGELLWYNANVSKHEDREHEFSGIVVVAHDITKRKKIETTLKESKDQYQMLVETSPEAITTADLNGTITFVSRQTLTLHGYKKEGELLGKSALVLIHPEDHDKALTNFQNTLDGTLIRNEEYILLRKDGSTFIGVLSGSLIKDSAGNPKSLIATTRDITHRKLAEEELKTSREFAENLVECSLDIIIAVDNKRKITQFNTAAQNTFGYTREEVIGKHVNLLYANTHEGLKVHKQTVLNGQHVQEIQNVRKNGEAFPTLLSASVLKDTEGNQIGVMGVSRDITKDKQAEDEILRQAAILKAINAVFQEALTCDTEEELGKTCLSVAERLTGSKFGFIGELNPEGLFDTIAISNPGWDACSLAVTDARKNTKSMTIRGIDRSTIRDGKSRIVNEKDMAIHPDRVGTPKGHPKLTAFLGVPLKQEGKTIGMIGLGNKRGGYEITDQEAVENLSVAIVEILRNKRAEAALETSEEKYRTLFEESRDPIYISSKGGKIIDHNEVWCDLFGYTKEEINEINAVNLFCNAGDRKRFQKAIEKTGHVKDLEMRYRKKDGTKMICIETATILDDSEGNIIGYQGTIRDVTEKIRTQRQLEQALKDAQKADKMKTMFLANMSHEIRTPLNAIIGFTDLLGDLAKETGREDANTFIHIIKKSGHRLLQTIHKILDISQVEAGSFKIQPEKQDLTKIVTQVIRELSSRAQMKKLELSFDSKVDTPVVVADEYCLTQALMNFIDNAIKYTKKGWVRISILEEEKKKLLLAIQDTGIGISAEYMDALYEPFSQESTGYNKKYQGIGLGLALSKRYLDLNHITLTIESKKGEGTAVILTFDRAGKRLPKAKKPKELQGVEIAETLERKPLILVVEDDVNSQNLIRFFTKNYCRLQFTRSVEGAKEKLKKHAVDLVLLDLSLEGQEDGLNLARYMRKMPRFKTTPVIAATAHAFVKDQENCLAAGCDDYLAKPIIKDQLLEKIQTHLN